MKNPKTAVFFGLIALLIVTLIHTSWAQVSTRRIDEVRDKAAKGMLDSRDLEQIDRFLSDAVRELTRTDDFSKIATARATILSRVSKQKQYAEQFTKSARQHINTSLRRAADLPEPRRFMVTLNLLVLIDNLGDPALADMAFDYVNTKNAALRYWAVRVATSPLMAKEVYDNPDSDLAQRVVKTAQSLTNDPSPDVVDLIIGFATKAGGQKGQAMLMDIAKQRIAQYQSGNVTDELLEVKLLKELCNRISDTNPQADILKQQFTQLFDLAMLRYLDKQDSLTTDQKAKLVSVMVEVESKCITKLLKQPQNNIKRALESSDLERLRAERDRLLGDGGALKTL